MCRSFNRRLALIIFALLLAPCLSLSAQEVKAEIDLDDGALPLDFAFGMKLSPDGTSLYVAICGSYLGNNSRVVEIDTQTYVIINEGTVGQYPEEFEFRLDGNGDIELIFVTNSTDGTVSVLNPDLSSNTTIDLKPHGGDWTTGCIMGPSGRYLYVSTFNMGNIYVIDTEPTSPEYLQVIAKHYVGGGCGRMALYGNKLVIPGADWAQGAFLKTLDLQNPSQVEEVILDNNVSDYPSAVDVEVSHDGYAYVPVLDITNPWVYEVDLTASPIQVSRVFDLSTKGNFYVMEHGIGASPGQGTLVVTYMDDSIIKGVSRKAGCALFSLDVDPMYGGQTNEALFSLDGKTVFITNQAQPKVYVVEGVPMHGLHLSGTQSVNIGGTVNLEMLGGEANQKGLLLASGTLGPIVTPVVTLDIGWPFLILVDGIFGADCALPIPGIIVPNDPGLHGFDVYFQGLTQDMDKEMRPSNLHTVEIL